MVVTVSAAVAGDLADVVDRVRVDQRPSRVLRDQGVQILRSFRGCPNCGVGSVIGEVAVPHDYIRVVHAEDNAVGASLQQTQVPDLAGRVPLDRMPPASGVKAVRLSDHDSVGINRIGHTRTAAGKGTEILHHCAVP